MSFVVRQFIRESIIVLEQDDLSKRLVQSQAPSLKGLATDTAKMLAHPFSVPATSVDPLGLKLSTLGNDKPSIVVVAKISLGGSAQGGRSNVREAVAGFGKGVEKERFIYIAKVYSGAEASNEPIHGKLLDPDYLLLPASSYILPEPSRLPVTIAPGIEIKKGVEDVIELEIPSKPTGRMVFGTGRSAGGPGSSYEPPTAEEMEQYEEDVRSAESYHRVSIGLFKIADSAQRSKDFMIKTLRHVNSDFYENFPGAKEVSLTFDQYIAKVKEDLPGAYQTITDCMNDQSGAKILNEWGLFIPDLEKYYLPAKRYTPEGARDLLQTGCPMDAKEYLAALAKWIGDSSVPGRIAISQGVIDEMDDEQMRDFAFCSMNMSNSFAYDLVSIVAGILAGSLGTPIVGAMTTAAVQIAPSIPVLAYQIKKKQYAGAITTCLRILGTAGSAATGGPFGIKTVLTLLFEAIAGIVSGITFNKADLEASINEWLRDHGLPAVDEVTIEEMVKAARKDQITPLSSILPPGL